MASSLLLLASTLFFTNRHQQQWQFCPIGKLGRCAAGPKCVQVTFAVRAQDDQIGLRLTRVLCNCRRRIAAPDGAGDSQALTCQLCHLLG